MTVFSRPSGGLARTVVIAHRGASAAYQENTIEAFVQARRLGADGVELDVRRTGDGALAVLHDPVVTGLGLLVELASGDLPPWLPLLGDAIAACDGMGVNIEMKGLPGEPDHDPDGGLARAVARYVGDAGLYERVLVSSFDLDALDHLAATDPRIALAWLTLPGREVDEVVGVAAGRGHTATHPHHLGLTSDLVDAAHSAGIAVNTWTVDDPERIALLADWGVDGICTNDPALARSVLGPS